MKVLTAIERVVLVVMGFIFMVIGLALGVTIMMLPFGLSLGFFPAVCIFCGLVLFIAGLTGEVVNDS